MNEMKLSSEAKIGLIGVLTILVIIWGINFLKGRNVLSGKQVFYTQFDDVQGLEPSANILMQGYKIGNVKDIRFDPNVSPGFLVKLEVEKKYPIQRGSLAEIFSADLLGTKAIRITKSSAPGVHDQGDTLRSGIAPDMLSELIDQVSPVAERIEALAETLDKLGNRINSVIADSSISEIIDNVHSTSKNLAAQVENQGDLDRTISNLESVTANIRSRNHQIGEMIGNLNDVSKKLNSHALDSTLKELSDFAASMNAIADQVETGGGSLGKLLYNDSLYHHITSLGASLDSLVRDLKSHPEKYVSFSVF